MDCPRESRQKLIYPQFAPDAVRIPRSASLLHSNLKWGVAFGIGVMPVVTDRPGIGLLETQAASLAHLIGHHGLIFVLLGTK